jgi:hypothetical protein
MRWPTRVPLVAAAVLSVLVLWQILLSPRARDARVAARLERTLRSDDPETRKQAVWGTVARPDSALVTMMVQDALGAEPDADVREAYIYALGRLGDPRNFAVIESTIDRDPSGYVRAAAWLAAARCDPRHFRMLVETRTRPERPWDQIGVGQGWLELDDVRGVSDLLHWACAGDDVQREVAARALLKWLRPLLDSVGRWPADCDVEPGDPWPRELVDEIAARCARLDLQAIADDNARHHAQTYRLQRDVRRITGFRDGLAELLVGDE